ncbi:MAG: restriction endonuclease, partial [Candidatus Marinimicrobia bacterium]|nr:restriction endonuclease [Candidatus Neomarinimicrobiota bacterium]
MSEETPYNPLDKRNLGVSVAEALLSRKAVPLGKVKRFKGAGIYVIYYAGGFPAYEE